jgi:hypothetical protein
MICCTWKVTCGYQSKQTGTCKKSDFAVLLNYYTFVRFVHLRRMKMAVLFVWVVMPWELLRRYHHFGETVGALIRVHIALHPRRSVSLLKIWLLCNDSCFWRSYVYFIWSTECLNWHLHEWFFKAAVETEFIWWSKRVRLVGNRRNE